VVWKQTSHEIKIEVGVEILPRELRIAENLDLTRKRKIKAILEISKEIL